MYACCLLLYYVEFYKIIDNIVFRNGDIELNDIITNERRHVHNACCCLDSYYNRKEICHLVG